MYSKEELLSKNISELQDIANGMGIETSNDANEEDVVYEILDKQAEIEGSKNPLGTKRRRTRIVKKDTDRVYTVSGKEGENFDTKKSKNTSDTVQPSLFKDNENEATEAENAAEEVPIEEQLPVIPKHRGRKSKKELELLSAIEAAQKAKAEAKAKQEEAKPLDVQDETASPPMMRRNLTTHITMTLYRKKSSHHHNRTKPTITTTNL